MFVELVERGINNRGNIVPIGNVGIAPRDYEAYISLFPFDKQVNEYVRINNTIKGYKGQHACTYICIDIDNESDKESSRLSALDTISRLNSRYNISSDDLFIYYSGNKGFHVYIVDRLIGIQNRYFDEIGAKCKSFIAENFGDIPNIDSKIYEDHRIIRIPNSRHAKTGMYKVEITIDELRLGMESICILAKAPRSLKRNKSYSDIHENTRFKDDFMSYFKGVKVVDRVSDGTFWGVMDKGNRNDGYYKQACSLFTYSELSEQSIFEIIYAINLSASDPVSTQELKALVRSASRTKSVEEEKEENLRLYTFRDAVPLWIDSIKPEVNKITLGFESFDNEMRGKLRGKVCDVIGYGGSKKSLLSQWIGMMNIKSNQRILYSTMEMGIPDLMTRAINMTVEPERFNAAFELEQMDKTAPQNVLKFLDEKVSDLFQDKLLMTDSSSMTAEKYDRLITDISNRTGKVDILIVDGLGMMGGKEKEVDRYSEATKELKELAKKWNMLVVIICHIAKGEERTTKDLSKMIRGSEKIVDNCDFYISMAQHRMTGADGFGDFNNRFGNARLVNKRGSGAVVDQFFELNTMMLQFVASECPVDSLNNNEISVNKRFL